MVTDEVYPDRSDWEVTWRAGARYTVSDALALRGAAYTSFRLPTLNELYRPFVVFPVTTQANAALLPAQVPEFAASVTAAYEFAPGGRLAATLRHVGEQFEGDLEDDALPAATTLDLYGQVPVWGELSLVGRVENLTDEDVVTRNQGGSIDLGAPRTLWLGLRWGY